MLYFLDGDICLDASHFYAVRRMHEYDVIIGRVVRLAVDESNTFRNQMISGGAFSLPFGQRLLFAKKVMKAKISCWARHLNIPLVGNVLPTHWPDLRSGNFAVRAGVFYKVNGFDESMLGWGGEDSDLGRRLYQSGARVGTFPWGCKAYHLWHPSAAEPSSSCRLHERLLYKTKVALHGLDSPFGQNDSELHILQ